MMRAYPDVRVQARARVQLTIEVEVTDRWGADCPAGQVYKQARESAIAAVQKLGEGKVRVLGEPRVTAILADMEVGEGSS